MNADERRREDVGVSYPSISPSASSRSAQYVFIRVAVAWSGSFSCWIATWLFAAPLVVKRTMTEVPSGQAIRIDLPGVVLRTVGLTPVIHRLRRRGSWNDRKISPTGAAKVRLLLASHAPLRRWPMARSPLIRS